MLTPKKSGPKKLYMGWLMHSCIIQLISDSQINTSTLVLIGALTIGGDMLKAP